MPADAKWLVVGKNGREWFYRGADQPFVELGYIAGWCAANHTKGCWGLTERETTSKERRNWKISLRKIVKNKKGTKTGLRKGIKILKGKLSVANKENKDLRKRLATKNKHLSTVINENKKLKTQLGEVSNIEVCSSMVDLFSGVKFDIPRSILGLRDKGCLFPTAKILDDPMADSDAAHTSKMGCVSKNVDYLPDFVADDSRPSRMMYPEQWKWNPEGKGNKVYLNESFLKHYPRFTKATILRKEGKPVIDHLKRVLCAIEGDVRYVPIDILYTR